MKKSVLIALAFLGLALGTTNAQSCCTIEKENCKPTTCCPVTPTCCTDDVADKKKVKGKKNTSTIAEAKTKHQKSKAIKKEVDIVENKKVKI